MEINMCLSAIFFIVDSCPSNMGIPIMSRSQC